MPWGISKAATRATMLQQLDALAASAKEGTTETEQHMVDCVAESVRAALLLAGEGRADTDRMVAALNASGRIQQDGSVYLYVDFQCLPAEAPPAPAAPAANAEQLDASRKRITAVLERIKPADVAAVVDSAKPGT